MSLITTLLWVTLFACLIQGILSYKCDKSKKLPKLPCLKKTFDIMDTSHDCILDLKEFAGIFYDKFTHGQFIRKETFMEAVNYKNFMNCGINAKKLFDYICKTTGYSDNIPMTTFINCFDQDRDGAITGVDFTYKFHQILMSTMRLRKFV